MGFGAWLHRFIGALVTNFIVNLVLLSAVNALTHLFKGHELLWVSLAIAAGDGLVSAWRKGDVSRPKWISPYKALCADGRWTFPMALAAVFWGHLPLFAGGFGGLTVLYAFGLIPLPVIPWSLAIVGGIQIVTVMALLAEHIYWGRTKQGTPAT